MMTIKESSRAHLTLVHIFHACALADTPWVAHALSLITPMRYGRVSSNSVTPKILYVPVHNSKLAHSDPTDAGLNRHRQGLPPWCSEFTIQTTLNLPIQYSPFSPNCPAQSPITPSRIIILLNYIGPPSLEKGPIASGFQPLVFD
jgi:hypothetical protein